MSNETAWIMWRARYPSNLEPPRKRNLHSTIVYLGDVTSLPPADEIVSALDEVDTKGVVTANVPRLDFFGPDETEAVLRLDETPEAPYLNAIFDRVAGALARHGISFHTDYPYVPHVTIDSYTAYKRNFPPSLILDCPQLWYGDKCTYVGTLRKFSDTWTDIG